jgi:nucleotidyltransferase/DNA polymerase involved in DNA repair
LLKKIKEDVKNELNISVSIGIAPTKVLAKVASKWVKPNGLTIITEDSINTFLEKEPIEKIWGIGPKTSELLKRKGIKTAKDFIDKSESWIKENLSKPYEVIWNELKGNRILELDPNLKNEYSSIQKTRSFHPVTNDKVFLLSQLSNMLRRLALRQDIINLFRKKYLLFKR